MARGGARPGAGRKPGAASKKTREIADKAAAEGLTPLEYMLGILRDEQQPVAMRFEAAKHAAPFVHPKLSSIEAKVDAAVKASVRRIERVVVDPHASDA
ncbi:MAG TPA: hypothetical protein VFN88_03575 [Caulobacteraceae bacterium]|nr:hypothetical protein [Caulobacteraceae bacterium]